MNRFKLLRRPLLFFAPTLCCWNRLVQVWGPAHKGPCTHKQVRWNKTNLFQTRHHRLEVWRWRQEEAADTSSAGTLQGRQHTLETSNTPIHSALPFCSHHTGSRLAHKFSPISVDDRPNLITNLADTGNILLSTSSFFREAFQKRRQ